MLRETGFWRQHEDADWWRSAVVYQIYPRSFADADGDGTGDVRGIIQRLGYLAELGVDAIWITPWYDSPLHDGGYDVADYRRLHDDFGSVDDAIELIEKARDHGIRVILDIVPNHVSHEHPWFREALAAGPGDPARARFHFHPGHGEAGGEPPTHWKNNFAGPVWTRTTAPDGTAGEWYLHLFDSSQPDLNWEHPDVLSEHEDILRFWFDRGVAGFRIDSAAHILKDPAYPQEHDGTPGTHPNLDRDGIHEVYESWRAVADSYSEPRVLVGEVWLPDAARFAAYLGPGRMHTAFNFDLMTQPWDADAMRRSVELMLAAHASVDAPATWVLSNHDVTRPVTRYGRDDSSFDFDRKAWGVPTDIERGTRRARAAFALAAALPGSLYIYQGEELGLPEVEDLPRDLLQDPMFHRSDGENPGRDGCRVPLPWSGTEPPFGFSPTGGTTWLPQPPDWASLTAEAQLSDPGSMLTLYRLVLRLRRDLPEHSDAPLEWDDSFGAGVVAFRRGPFVCATNFGARPARLPGGSVRLLSTADSESLTPDSTVWLRRS